jgi:uncharacterized protein YqhQ
VKSDHHPSPGPIGGQALVEGVMMRRGECWGAAVRGADGTISTTQRALPASLSKWRKVPLVRGVLAIGETAGLGTQAMVWAAKARLGEDTDDGFSKSGLALSTVVAAALAIGVFVVLPAAVAKVIGVHGAVLTSLVEGGLRLAVLIGYSCLIALSSRVRRVFGYHGAEHMTIHAFEHGVPLEVAEIRAFDRRHPRCGTAFLILVVVVTVFVNALIGYPSWPLLVASRILALPLVAGLAFESIRIASVHEGSWYARLLTAPGSLLQSLTTQVPDDDQIEVAVAALQATLAQEAALHATVPSVAGAVA